MTKLDRPRSGHATILMTTTLRRARCRSAVPGQVSREVIDDLSRIVFDAVDERGRAPPQDGQSQGVQAGAVDDAAVVAKLALPVDDGHVEPPIVRPEPGCPHDRA